MHKISPSTIARTAALALALTNQILSATGHAVLPIESAQLEQLVSTGLTVAAALVSWWKPRCSRAPPFSEKTAITKTTLPKQGCKRTFWVYPSFLRR